MLQHPTVKVGNPNPNLFQVGSKLKDVGSAAHILYYVACTV